MTLFEGVCIGFLVGVVATLISILGVMYGVDKAEHDGDRDVDSCNCGTYRNCCGMDRYCKGDDGK